MELVPPRDPIFADLHSLDEAYSHFMNGIRAELAEASMNSTQYYCYNFTKDGVLDVEEQKRYVWESVGEEKNSGGDAGFAYQGRVSVASMDTLATFNTADFEAEAEIPEIPFSKMGRTSLTSEEFVNEIPPATVEESVEDEEEEEGSAHPVPYQHGSAHTPGGLPFGKQR